MTSEGTWFTSQKKKVNKNFLPVCGKSKQTKKRGKNCEEILKRKKEKILR